ncbi:OmpA family protein [bacterium A37T11]|nr:OmpA family protein [bacterium A37T11]
MFRSTFIACIRALSSLNNKNMKNLIISLFFCLPCKAQLFKIVKDRAVQSTANVIGDGIDKAIKKSAGKAIEDRMNGNQTASTGVYTKYDFVPGDSILYATDFVLDNVGELPAGWNSSSNGVVVESTSPAGKWLQLNQGIFLAGIQNNTFGKNYSVEFDVLLDVTSKSGYYLPPIYYGALGSGKLEATNNVFLKEPHVNNAFEFKIEPKENIPSVFTLKSFEEGRETFNSESKRLEFFAGTLRKVAHYAISVQNTRLRMWINEVKVIDVPKAVNVHVPINQLYFKTENTGGFGEGSYRYLISNLKVATGFRDNRSKLISEGKLVTTGILFDVNSAEIKPQSYAVIKEIATILKEHGDLKISIIGHTDADGNADANLVLSEKRAAAIKDFLAKEFAIDGSRLTTVGKGASQPIADNKTSTGKAANRRVEFVKL